MTHLVELLRVADPESVGISEVIVWGGRRILDRLPARSWLRRQHCSSLDGSLPSRVLWQRLRLDRLARESCDVLFVPGGSYSGGFRPVVTMSRNLVPFDRAAAALYGLSWMRLRSLILSHLQTRTLRTASGVIFLTETAHRTVARRTGPLSGRITTIPHGISGRFLRPPMPQQPLSAYSSARPFRWLYVSIVDVYKHQWNVAEAVALLRREGMPVALDLVGPAYPPALPRLTRVLEEVDPDGEFIRYHGPVEHTELPALYHGADGFAFASSCENLPNILLEAMAAGLPIACADRSVMPEVLGDAGEYFDPESVPSVAAALRRLTSSAELRETCALRAHARAGAYSWERCAQETFAFLAAVAGRAAGVAEDSVPHSVVERAP